MRSAPALHRWSALIGLAFAAAVAAWWLGSTRVALERGSDPLRASTDALVAAWLGRAVMLAMTGVRGAALRGWRDAAQASAGLIAPAWPLVALAGAASAVAWVQIVAIELGLLAAGLALPLAGAGIRRVLSRAEVAEPVATTVGIGLAAVVWFAWTTGVRP